jgi:hypothetical protein
MDMTSARTPNRLSRFQAHVNGIACGFVVVVFASLAIPLLHQGFLAGHDSSSHIPYMYLFDRALQQGQVPVRWVESVRNGYSQPLFNFYQPGFYYLVDLIHGTVPSLALSFKLTVLLLWWLGGIFAFLLFRRLGVLPAALAAVLFALSPYVILDVFVRAAYPEFAAIMFLPGILWSLEQLATTGRPRFAVLFAFFTGIMLVSHLPASLVFAPVLLGYIFTLPRETRWGHITACAGAAILGVALAAFYVLPALVEKQFVRMKSLTSQYYDYHIHFVYPSQWIKYSWGYGFSVAGPNDGMSFQIGVLQWVVIGCSCVVVLFGLSGNRFRNVRRHLLFWLLMVGYAMFMTIGRSHRLWEMVAPLQYLQFPWRFLMLVSLGCAALGAHLLSLVGSRTQGVLVLVAVGFQVAFYHAALRPARYLLTSEIGIDGGQWSNHPIDSYAEFREEPGYFPVGAVHLPAEGVGRWLVTSGNGQVFPIIIKDDRFIADVTTSLGCRLTITSHFFPGWTLIRDGQEVPLILEPDTGYMSIDIPSGRHRIEARFADTRVRELANWLSLGGLMGVCIMSVGLARRPAPQGDLTTTH